MHKPLEMRGWAIRHTNPDGGTRLLPKCWFPVRKHARQVCGEISRLYRPGHRYTVVPVVVRERR